VDERGACSEAFFLAGEERFIVFEVLRVFQSGEGARELKLRLDRAN